MTHRFAFRPTNELTVTPMVSPSASRAPRAEASMMPA